MPASVNKEKKTPPPGELALLFMQLSLVARSGIPIHEGVRLIGEELPDSTAKRLILSIDKLVFDNMPLYEAMERCGAVPGYAVKMVKAGELSGRLEEVFSSLARYYEREDELSRHIRGAAVYPFLLFLMMSAVIIVLVVKVLPVFYQVFVNLGADVNPLAAAMMKNAMLMGRVTAAVVSVVAVVAVIMVLLSRTKGGRERIGRIFYPLPILGAAMDKVAAARFASALSMLLSSGMDVKSAARQAASMLSGSAAGGRIAKCADLIENGMSLSRAAMKSGVLGGLMSRMVAVGEMTGELDRAAGQLGELLSGESDANIDYAVGMIEPVMAVVLSVLIGAVLLSAVLPLMAIMSSIG